MNTTYSVTRQRSNCGPTQTIYVESREAADRAFDLAVAQGDNWVSIWNETRDHEVLRHLDTGTHTAYTDAGRFVNGVRA